MGASPFPVRMLQFARMQAPGGALQAVLRWIPPFFCSCFDSVQVNEIVRQGHFQAPKLKWRPSCKAGPLAFPAGIPAFIANCLEKQAPAVISPRHEHT